MEGYANMGIDPYIKLREFSIKHDDYTFTDCIAFCQNTVCHSQSMLAHKVSKNHKQIEVFEEGTWNCGNINTANDWANKIRMVKPYYDNYNRSTFVTIMISLFKNQNFDFNEFMHKLRLQPTALVDCANREQFKTLIEDIYNYKNRNKVNLRF